MNTINLTYNIIDDLKKCEGWRFKEKSRRRYVDAAHAAGVTAADVMGLGDSGCEGNEENVTEKWKKLFIDILKQKKMPGNIWVT